jgi:hypothetical protein
MENPVIRIWGMKVQSEYENKWHDWQLGAYTPLWMNIPEVQGDDFYRIAIERPEYNKYLSIFHYKDRNGPIKIRTDKRFIDIQNDMTKTWSNKIEVSWRAGYEQIIKYTKHSDISNVNSKPGLASSALIHLEGFSFSNPENQEKYDTWFEKWGTEVFVPLLMKSTGLNEYTRYGLIDITAAGLNEINTPKREAAYPTRLSILGFDSLQAFKDYENSMELAAFRSALQTLFPLGLDCQWYVQYQLEKSFRK